jgi:hypothetical protein
MSVLVHLSSSVHKRYLFECITRRYVSSCCFLPTVLVLCVLFSVVLVDAVVLLPSLLYASLVCIFPQCWISSVYVSLYSHSKHWHHKKKTAWENIPASNVLKTNTFYERMTTYGVTVTYFHLELIHFKYTGKYSAMVSARQTIAWWWPKQVAKKKSKQKKLHLWRKYMYVCITQIFFVWYG